MLSPDEAYLALKARDARFDGQFFVGVSSTGIYCRPVCRVRLPLKANCRFYELASQAEAAGFRPCLRCRPELAPGRSLKWSQMDASTTLAHQAAQLLQTEPDLACAAKRLGVTDRHLRRIFTHTFGVPPVQYLQTQRLLLAKALLTDSSLKVTDVALASGFQSLRRFNAAFTQRYRLNPSQLRKASSSANRGTAAPSDHDDKPLSTALQLKLAWRTPFAPEAFMRFLQKHDVPSLEATVCHAGQWQHTRALSLWLGDDKRASVVHGWVRVSPIVTDPLRGAGYWTVHLSASFLPHLHRLPALLRRWLDTDAEAATIGEHLSSRMASMPNLRGLMGQGIRVPGVPGDAAGFELAVRTVIGQQVTLKAAITLTRRLVAAFAEPEHDEAYGRFPQPEALANASAEDLGRLGLVRQRVAAIKALAQATASGDLRFDPTQNPSAWVQQLCALPGIGPWTASYLAMRVLHAPDVLLDTDMALLIELTRLSGASRRLTPAEARVMGQAWSPWRSYAVMAIWNQYLSPPTVSTT